MVSAPFGPPLIDDDRPGHILGRLRVLGPGRIRCESMDGRTWSEWSLCEAERCTPHGLPIVELTGSSTDAALGQVRHWDDGFTMCQ